MTRRIAVRAIIVDQGKLLCVKIKDPHSNAVTDFWCLPGGGMLDGEDILSALRREMIEETGIEPNIGNLLFVQQFDAGGEQLEFFFHVKNTDDYKNIDLAKASHAVLEIAHIEFIDPGAAYVLPEFLTAEPLEQFIAGSLPPKVFSYLPAKVVA